MDGLIEVIMRDGNRTVNWEFPADTTLGEVLAKWGKGYYPVQSVVAYGTEIPYSLLGCCLTAFTEDRHLRMIVRTKFPKKHREEEDE